MSFKMGPGLRQDLGCQQRGQLGVRSAHGTGAAWLPSVWERRAPAVPQGSCPRHTIWVLTAF